METCHSEWHLNTGLYWRTSQSCWLYWEEQKINYNNNFYYVHYTEISQITSLTEEIFQYCYTVSAAALHTFHSSSCRYISKTKQQISSVTEWTKSAINVRRLRVKCKIGDLFNYLPWMHIKCHKRCFVHEPFVSTYVV